MKIRNLIIFGIMILLMINIVPGADLGGKVIDNGYDIDPIPTFIFSTTSTTIVPTTAEEVTTTSSTSTSSTTTTSRYLFIKPIYDFGIYDYQEEIVWDEITKIDRITTKDLQLLRNSKSKFDIQSTSNMTFKSEKEWVHYEAGVITHVCENECIIKNTYSVCDNIKVGESYECVDYSPKNLEGEFIEGLSTLEVIDSKTVKITHGDNYDPTFTTIGLIAYYPLNGNADDIVGSRDGVVNGATYNASGFISGSYDFDGDNDYIDIGLNAFSDTPTMSVSLWFITKSKVNDEDNKSTVFSLEGDVDFLDNYVIPNQTLSQMYNGTSNNHNFQVYPITVNEWHHLVVTKNQTHRSVYIDNTLISTPTEVGGDIKFSVQERNSTFGSAFDGAKYFLNGSIDEVMIYNTGLTPAEIEGIYLAQTASHDSSLLLNTTFDESTYMTNTTGNILRGGYGALNGAIAFNGDDNSPDESLLVDKFDLFNQDITTLSIWTKFNIPWSNPVAHYIYDTLPSGDYRFDKSSNYLLIEFQNAGNIQLTNNTGTPTWYSTTEWTHFVIVADAGSDLVYTYINGELYNVSEYTFAAAANGRLSIGSNRGQTQEANASIDEFFIVGRNVTQAEIASLYAGGSPTQKANTIITDSIKYYNSMDVIFDSSGSNTNITAHGNPIITNSTRSYTKSKNAIEFDGIDDYLLLDSMTFPDNTFTVTAWFNGKEITGDFAKRQNLITLRNGAYIQLQFYEAPDVLQAKVNHNDYSVSIGSGNFSSNDWYQVVFTGNGTDAKLYLDGVFMGNTSYPTIVDAGTINNIGVQTSTSFFFNGSIDDVKIYTNSLSSEEVLALYESESGDIIAPAITIVSPANTTYNETNSIDFNITSDETLSSCIVSLDNFVTNNTMTVSGTTANYTNHSMNASAYTAKYSCVDSSGNVNNTENISFTITYVPGLILTTVSPTNTTYPYQSIDFNITANNALDICVVSIDNYITNHTMTVSGTTANYTNGSMTDGSYTALFYCNDTTSLTDENSISFTVFYDDAPVMDTSRMTPTPTAYDGVDLIGYCNATDEDSENVSYGVGWYNGSTFYQNPDDTWCYQETANISTICGGLATGTYETTGFPDYGGYEHYKAYDEDYDTYAATDDTGATFYVNYTVPFNASKKSLWQTKAEIGGALLTINRTIPEACWDGNNIAFKIYVYYDSSPSVVGEANLTCFDGTGYNAAILYDNSPNNPRIYEEAMFWNYGGTTQYPEGVEANVENLSSEVTTIGEIWTQACRAYDGTRYSEWLNSPSTEIVGNPAFALSITYPITNLSYNAVTLNYTTSADDSCWYSTDGGLANSSTVTAGENFTGLLSVEGMNNWTVYCNDTYNTIQSDTTNFRTDTAHPIIQSARITPSPTAYNAENLMGYCNATDEDTENITYSYSWYNGTSLFKTTNEDRCYQETATVSTECGGLSTGSYRFEPYYFYINYTISEDFVLENSTWIVKTGISLLQNIPLENCSSSGVLQLRIKSRTTSPNQGTSQECYNGVSWIPIGVNVTNTASGGQSCSIFTKPLYDGDWGTAAIFVSVCEQWTNDPSVINNWPESRIFEEAVNWSIGNKQSYPQGIESNVANLSSEITNTGENWTFECMADDSIHYSNLTNSTLTEILGNPAFALSITYPITNLSYNAVTLNYTTAADDSCWYSTDGGLVNSSTVTAGENFTGLLSVEGMNNWTVYCNDTYNTIQSDTTNFRTDTIAPTLTVEAPTQSTHYRNPVLINITTSDTNTGIDSVWYYNSTENVPYTVEQNIELADGNYSFIFYVNDTVGNTNTTIVNFTVDNTAPSITVYSPEETNYSSSSVLINFTATDLYTDQLWYNNGTDNISYSSAHYDTLADANYLFTFYANDTLDNIGNTTINFTVDTTGPVVTVVGPTARVYNSSSIKVTFSAVDALLPVDSLWYFNGTDNITYTGHTNTTLSDGEHTLYFYANDTLGNIGSNSVTLSIDTTLPTVTIDFPTETSYDYNFSDLNYSTDAIDSCWYSTDFGTTNLSIQTAGLNFTIPIVNDGTHNWTVYCNNSLNSIGSDHVNFLIDTTGPNIQVSSPSNISYGSATLLVNFSATDATTSVDSLWYYNEVTNVTFTVANYIGVADGTHEFVFYANDTLGNINQTVINFTINTTLPIVSITNPLSTNYSTRTFDIEYNTTGDDSCWYYNGTNTSAPVPAGTSFTSQPAIEGDNMWIVTCNNTVDREGNSSIFFTVDTINPTITVYSPTSKRYNTDQILINFTGIDTHTITQFYFNGVTNVTYTAPTVATVGDGDWDFTFYVNDSAGNINSTTINFSVDTVNPAITMNFPSLSNSSTWINESAMPFNITFFDANLFGYNITCPGEYSVENISINVTTANFYDTHLFTTVGVRNCTGQVADDHTANIFNPKVEIKQPVFGFGNRRIDINDGDIVYEFDSRNRNTLSSLSFEKKEDRISPIIELKKETADIYWTVTYKGKVFDRQEISGIQGHIVVIPRGLESGYWFDAENDVLEGADVSYEFKNNKVLYHAKIKGDNKVKTFKTKSIGGLNIVNFTFSFEIVGGRTLNVSGYDLITDEIVPINISFKNGTNWINYTTETSKVFNLDCGTTYTFSISSSNYTNTFYQAFDGCAYNNITAGFYQSRVAVTTKNIISGDSFVGTTLDINGTDNINYSTSQVSTATPEYVYLYPGNYTINVSKSGYASRNTTFNVTFGETRAIELILTPVYTTYFVREQTGEDFSFLEESTSYTCENGSQLTTNYTTQEDPGDYECGGNWSVTHPCEDAVDGVYTTWGQSANLLLAYLNETYMKPTESTNETEIIIKKDIIQSETYVMSDFQSCWDQTELNFQYVLNSTSVNMKIYCMNATGWQLMDSVGGSLYDAQVKWASQVNETIYDQCTNTTQMSVSVEIYCPDTVLTYSIDSLNPEVTGVNCPYTYWLVRPVYSEATYYRTIIPPVDEITTYIYLLDLNLDEAIEVIILLKDIASQYEDGQVVVYKYVNGTRVKVIQQYLDIEQRAVLWLDKWETYEICTITSGGVEECHGDLLADEAGTKTLTLPVIPFTDVHPFSSDGVSWAYNADQEAGTLDLIYNDDSANGYNSLTWIVKDSSNNVVSSEVRMDGYDTEISVTGLHDYEDYTSSLVIDHKDIEVDIYEQKPIWYAIGETFPGFEEYEDAFKLLVAMIVPIVIVLLFSTITVEIGITFALIFTSIFNSYNWYALIAFGGEVINGVPFTWIDIVVVLMSLYTFLLWMRKARKTE